MATENDTTRVPELKLAVTALGRLPELLKPYTVEGTQLRLPKEIHDGLRHTDELSRLLGEVHYEGVHYDYQDESAERDRQIARGLVPAEGTTDGEDGLYHEATMRERWEAIVRLGDAPKAISHAMGALQAIHGLGRILQQDAIRDDDDFVLSIAHMIVEESERMNEFAYVNILGRLRRPVLFHMFAPGLSVSRSMLDLNEAEACVTGVTCS